MPTTSRRRRPKALLEDSGGELRTTVTFHVSRKNNVYFATPMSGITRFYRLEKDRFTEIGTAQYGNGPENNHTIMTTDANETLYFGRAINTKEGYGAWKLVNGKPEEVFARGDLNTGGHSAVFHWNTRGELILTLGGINRSYSW